MRVNTGDDEAKKDGSGEPTAEGAGSAPAAAASRKKKSKGPAKLLPKPSWIFKADMSQFLSVQVYREEPEKPKEMPKTVIMAASRDGSIRELVNTIEPQIKGEVKTKEIGETITAVSRKRYEAGYQYQKMLLMPSRKAFFAGVGNPG